MKSRRGATSRRKRFLVGETRGPGPIQVGDIIYIDRRLLPEADGSVIDQHGRKWRPFKPTP